MKQFHTRKAQGFTLVELAIVITIIGILIGGVLKGQQLIDQARLAGTIAQVRDFRSALMIFQTKYDALPGDMENPDNRIIGCSECEATYDYTHLGDGKIDGGTATDLYYGGAYHKTSEQTRFWLHLYKAEMITGVNDAALTEDQPVSAGTTHPAAKISGGFYTETGNGGCGGDRYRELWGGCEPNGHFMIIKNPVTGRIYDGPTTRVMSPAMAAQIDRKMDDGKPFSGGVRGLSVENGVGSGCGEGTPVLYPEAETDGDVCSVGFDLGG